MKKILAALLSVSLIAASLAGCSPAAPSSSAPPAAPSGSSAPDANPSTPAPAPADAGDVIKIGVFEPLTGANAAGGQLEADGMILANKLYPEVLGKKIELVVVDNKSEKADATIAVARLIEKEKVSAILGSWGSGLSIAAGDLVKNNKIPAVGASCTNPLVTEGNDYYFRVCFLDPFQGTVMANYAYNKLGARKAALIQEVSNDYAVGLAKFFKDAFIELTGDPDAIVATANYNTGDQDFSSQLTAVGAKNPDVIFAPGNFTESAMIIKQARKQGIQTPIIGGDTWETNEFITVGGAEVEGTVLSTFFDGTNPVTDEAKKFIDAFNKEKPGEVPAAVTALGYDSYLIVYKAIEQCGSADPQKIRDELAKMKNFEGVTGMIDINENGDADKNSAVIKVVKDGKFEFLDNVIIEK